MKKIGGRHTTAKSYYRVKIDLSLERYKHSQELLPLEIKFESRGEALKYIELKQLETLGKISKLEVQVPFVLIPKGRWFNNLTGKEEAVRDLKYNADFVFHRDGRIIVADYKGWKPCGVTKKGVPIFSGKIDDKYIIKKKIFLTKYPELIFEEY